MRDRKARRRSGFDHLINKLAFIPERSLQQFCRFAFGQTILAQPALGRFFIRHHYVPPPINRRNEVHAHPDVAGGGPMREVFATGVSGGLTHIICSCLCLGFIVLRDQFDGCRNILWLMDSCLGFYPEMATESSPKH
jgi:hypothetical protein